MKKFVAFLSVCTLLMCLTLSLSACKEPDAPNYENKDFVLAGFVEPYELNEQTLSLYKESGLNTLTLTNHAILPRSTNTQSYLGSNRTQNALQLCRQLDLQIMLSYHNWLASACGEPYNTTPFSSNNIYDDYKDIIIAMHIADEPNYDTMDDYGDNDLVSDYKSVYSVPYLVNLFPNYVDKTTMHARNYAEYLTHYEETIVSKFEDNNPIVSVDFYPFRSTGFEDNWLSCYEQISALATKYNAVTHYYIQSAQSNEFAETLSEKDIRLQVNVALCFGAKWLSYYCYSNPMTCTVSNGNYNYDKANAMYDKCMLDANNEPTEIYYYVQKINNEVQNLSDAILHFDYVSTTGITNKHSDSYNTAILKMFNTNFNGEATIDSTLTKVATDGDCIVGKFNKKSENAYMLVNFGEPSKTSAIDIALTFENTKYVAIYTANSTEPQIVRTKKNMTLTLDVGECAFVVAL